MNLIRMWNKNGREINLKDYGLIGLALIPEAPSYTSETEQIPGMDGVINLGKQLNPRNLEARFLIQSFDYTDSLVKRDEIYDLLNGQESFYIDKVKQPHKRWFVESTEAWTPDRLNTRTWEITLNLIAYSGRAKSSGTSTMASAFEHINAPVDYTDYTMNATKFRIYNPGKKVDPRNINHYLKITYKGNSENLRIKNLTTGDEWAYNGVSNPGDEIVLFGIRAEKNGASIFRRSNKKLITLAAETWNEFEIFGAPDAREYAVQANMPRKRVNEIDKANPITFEFKFIY